MSAKIVFSCQADFKGVALQEILNTGAPLKFIKWIDGGAGLLEYDGAFADFSALVKAERLIFLRHILPAEYVVGHGELDFIYDFAPRMDKYKNFSVQLRAADDGKLYESVKIKKAVADYFKAGGFTENKRHPEQVISAFISDNLVYAGLSQAEENLSIWSGGMRHYAMRPDTISRAGFKLMEALEASPIAFRQDSAALDLGAAPGGWTKVLLDNGLRVVAVDPVQLSPVLQADKRVEYHSVRAHEYLKKSSRVFDLIVNDMSMNIMGSIDFMLSLKSRLRDGGHIIMTFKLTRQDRIGKINAGIELLRSEFDVVFLKQLFHNRSEVTVIVRKNW